MKKYLMKDVNDYRTGKGSKGEHGVKLIRQNLQGEDWVIGEFKTIDEDMLDLTLEDQEALDSLSDM